MFDSDNPIGVRWRRLVAGRTSPNAEAFRHCDKLLLWQSVDRRLSDRLGPRRELYMGSVQVYNSRSESYAAAAGLLRRVRESCAPSMIWVESIGKQNDILSPHLTDAPDVVAFQAELAEIILQNMCHIRQLVRVSDALTLESTLRQYVVPFGSSQLYEVRAVVLEHPFNTLSPLIVGELDTMIGIGRGATMTEACLHLHDRAATNLVKAYFEELWNDRRAVTIRNASGAHDPTIDLLRNALHLRTALLT